MVVIWQSSVNCRVPSGGMKAHDDLIEVSGLAALLRRSHLQRNAEYDCGLIDAAHALGRLEAQEMIKTVAT